MRYLSGATTARLGDDMSAPAVLLFGLAVTGSPADAALVLTGLTVSTAVGGPVLGAMLDRSPIAGRLLAVMLGLYGLGVAALLAVLPTLPLTVVVSVGVAAGLFAPALTGAWTAQLERVASPDLMLRGYALDTGTYNAAGLVGPGLAAVLATVFDAAAAVAVSAVLVLAAIPFALTLPARPPAPGPPRTRTSLVADVHAGFAAIVRSADLAAATALSLVSYAGYAAFVVSVPGLGERISGRATLGPLLLSVSAVAALVAVAAVARWLPRARPYPLLLAATALVGVGLAVAASAHHAWWGVVAAVLVGLGAGPQLAALFGVRHAEAPARLRTQVFTTAASLKTGAFAIGAAVGGRLAEYSVTWSLLAAAAAQPVALTLASAVRYVPGRGRRRPRVPAGERALCEHEGDAASR
ncbi:MAG: MFS transporter [Streptosporangiales bacterium]|nr:MFS transporter [Streptosporangiales bacterium]